jgi:hypothetical protein
MSAISHGYADYRTRAAPRVRGSFICGSEPWLVDEPLRRGELLRYGATVPVRAPTSVSDPSAPSPARRKGGPARPGGESLRAKSASGTRPARISSPSCARTPPPADGPRESSSMPGSLAPKSPNRHSMICYALPAVGRWTRWWFSGRSSVPLRRGTMNRLSSAAAASTFLYTSAFIATNRVELPPRRRSSDTARTAASPARGRSPPQFIEHVLQEHH